MCKKQLPSYVLAGGFLALLLLGWVLANTTATPDITLEDLEGRPHHMSEYIGKGKWTIVNIWGPKCPPCQEEVPELVRFHDEHKNSDAIVVGIALDYPSFGDAQVDEVAEFAGEYLVSYPLLLGNAEVAGRFGAGPLLATPTTFAFSPAGELVGVQMGVISREVIENFIRNYSPGEKRQ